LVAGVDIDQMILGKRMICWLVYQARECYNEDDHCLELWYRNLHSVLRNEVDVDTIDSNGDFALRLACGLRNDHRSILIDELLNEYVDVEKLITHDATINAVDVNGGSALHLACKWQANPAMIEALLRNGIDPTIRDRWGHIARYYMESVNEVTEGIGGISRFEILKLFRGWGVEHDLV